MEIFTGALYIRNNNILNRATRILRPFPALQEFRGIMYKDGRLSAKFGEIRLIAKKYICTKIW
jgi:hypothetical protein